MAKKNLILVSLDCLRADHLGCYDYRRNTSPNLDSFAREGIVFNNAFANTPWTAPSHMTMLTGCYPSTHGIMTHKFLEKLSPAVKTLPEILGQHGYNTAAFIGGGWMKPNVGFIKGFDVFNAFGLAAGGAKYSTGLVVKFMEANLNQPFFIFLHFFDIHHYAPPKDFAEKFLAGKKTPKELEGLSPKIIEKIVNASFHPQFEDYSDELKDYLIDLYDAEISYSDLFIGLLKKKLEELGLLEKTIVVFVSDHGDGFFEHKMTGHGFFFYDELIHVPLIISGAVEPKSKRFDEIVSMVDLAPSLLSLLGVDSGIKFEGNDFSTLFKGKEFKSEYYGEASHIPTKCFRDSKWKLITKLVSGRDEVKDIVERHGFKWTAKAVQEFPLEDELFDLERDPGEQKNIASENLGKVNELKEKIERKIPGKQEKAKKKEFAVFDAQTKRELQGLGYL